MHLFLNNHPDALIIPILFCYKTLHVSGIFSAHHQEFSTVQSSSVISRILLKVNLQFVSTSFPNVQTFTYHSKTHYDMKLLTLAPPKFLYLLYRSYRWWVVSNIMNFLPNFSKLMQFYRKGKGGIHRQIMLNSLRHSFLKKETGCCINVSQSV